jgi:hypothetical protein
MEYLRGQTLIDGIMGHFKRLAEIQGTTIEALQASQAAIDAEREARGLARVAGSITGIVSYIYIYIYITQTV